MNASDVLSGLLAARIAGFLMSGLALALSGSAYLTQRASVAQFFPNDATISATPAAVEAVGPAHVALFGLGCAAVLMTIELRRPSGDQMLPAAVWHRVWTLLLALAEASLLTMVRVCVCEWEATVRSKTTPGS
jgi:hypothetical protein